MPALDALTAKVTLREDLDSGVMLALMTGYFHSLEVEGGGRRDFPSDVSRDRGHDFVGKMRKWLDASEAFYVHPRMSELVTAASESLPEEPLVPEDLPTPQGFVLIPGGLTSIDVSGNVVQTNAVLWSAHGGRVSVVMLTDKHDPLDQKQMQERGIDTTDMPRYTVVHTGGLEFGKPLPISAGPDMVIPPEYGVQVRYQKNPDGSTNMYLFSDKGYSQEELAEMFSFGMRPEPIARWLVTMWRLMQQPLTSIEKEVPTRQMRRQLERRNAPDRHVSVVTLRRKAERGNGDTEVNWSHRWLVRGHWRRQPYKEGGETIYRHIWIHPHIKGPEDAPLLVREHVYSLER